MPDVLSGSIEREVKRLLRLARENTFEDQLNALKVGIVWYAQSRKLVPDAVDNSGSLLAEMRNMIEGTAANVQVPASGDGERRGPGRPRKHPRPAASSPKPAADQSGPASNGD